MQVVDLIFLLGSRASQLRVVLPRAHTGPAAHPAPHPCTPPAPARPPARPPARSSAVRPH